MPFERAAAGKQQPTIGQSRSMRIANAAVFHSGVILRRWLPDGHREGHEWIALNPTRHDNRKGSFKVNLATGRWADFATGDRGANLIALAAYLHGLDQRQAAEGVAGMLGIDPYE